MNRLPRVPQPMAASAPYASGLSQCHPSIAERFPEPSQEDLGRGGDGTFIVREIDVRTFFAPIREYRNALMAGYAKVCAIRDEMRKQQRETE